MTSMSSDFEKRVKDHYVEDQGKTYHLKKRGLGEDLFPWVIRLRAEKFQPFISASDSVFEYGAGNGWNLIGLKCKSKAAYDISTLNLGRMEANGIEFHHQEESIPKDKFDSIICHHVLEHVPYPGVTLSFLRDRLNLNGKLILVVPLEGQTNNTYDRSDREGHIYAWTAQTLGNLVDRSGFQVKEIQVRRCGYDRFAAELAKKLKVGEFGFRWLRKLAYTIRSEKEIILIAQKAK